jgi:hypothetical protein
MVFETRLKNFWKEFEVTNKDTFEVTDKENIIIKLALWKLM